MNLFFFTLDISNCGHILTAAALDRAKMHHMLWVSFHSTLVGTLI